MYDPEPPPERCANPGPLQTERPVLAHQIVTEAVVALLLNELEPSRRVETPSRNQHVVGPQGDALAVSRASEVEAGVHQPGSDAVPRAVGWTRRTRSVAVMLSAATQMHPARCPSSPAIQAPITITPAL